MVTTEDGGGKKKGGKEGMNEQRRNEGKVRRKKESEGLRQGPLVSKEVKEQQGVSQKVNVPVWLHA